MNKPQPLSWTTGTPATDLQRGDMSVASIQSNVIHLLGRGGSLFLKWIGTPTGTITINASDDHIPDAGSERNGNWESINSLITPPLTQPAGAGAQMFINLDRIRAAYLYVDYTRSAGSGVLIGSVMSEKA